MDEKNCVRLYICSPLRAETKNQVAKNRRLALEYELAVRKCIQNHLQREETESAIVRTLCSTRTYERASGRRFS